MKKLFTLLSLTSLILFGQTGPGGIKSFSEIEMWLDAGQINSASSGSDLGLWEDESGNGSDMLQALTIRRPTYFDTGGSNGKPYVFFSGDYMTTANNLPNMDSDQVTWLYVGEFSGTPSAYQFVISNSYASNSVQYASYYHVGLGRVVDVSYAPGYKAVQNNFSVSTEMHMAMRNGSAFQNYTNGGIVQSRNDLSGAPSGHGHIRIGARAGSSPTYYFSGNLYEVMAINTSMNDAEINILSNYLASKYALTPSLELYTHDAGHGENVIGIGQETNGSNLSARGLGIITLSGATLMADGLYLMLGDDNVSLANTSTNVPATEPAGTNRFERVWRVGETQGDVGDVTVTLHIDTYRPGTNPSTINMYIDSDGDFTNATTITGTYDAPTETVTFTYNFSDGDYVSFGGSEGDIESTGVTNDWALTTTWNCGCIPSLSDSVTVLTGHFVTVSTLGPNARTVHIQTGGGIVMTGGNLTIEEDFDIQGQFTASAGELILDGGAQHTVNSANAFTAEDFNIASSLGATLTGGPYTINGTFTMAGNIDNSGATDFIINSTGSADGRIAAIAGSIDFSDPITIRRNLPSGPADYRSLTPLKSNWTLSDWDDELIISGNGFPDGCASLDGACFYSAKYYSGATGFQDITGINDQFGASVGIHMYVGDDLNNFSGAVLETTGNIVKGTYQTNGFTTWNMIGNSYPSAIDFESLQAVSFRMDNFYYVYDPIAGAYDWYEPLGSGGLDQYIAMGQGFWVLPPTGATQPLLANWNELLKTDQTATFRSMDASSSLYLRVSSSRDNFGNKIAFNTVDTASLSMDNADIPYLQTPNEDAPFIAVKNEYDNLINVSYWNEDELTATFPVIVNTPYMDYYTISAENLDNFHQYECVYLLDLKTNESINMREEGSYTFFVDQSKSYDSRFLLVCSNDGSCSSVNEEVLGSTHAEKDNQFVKLQQMNNFFNVTFNYNEGEQSRIEVLNTLGQVVYDSGNFNMAKGTKTINTESHVSGVHFIRISHGNDITTEKVFISK